MKEGLPELGWGSMWLPVGRQEVHRAGESQWVRRAWHKNHAQGDREQWKIGKKERWGKYKV